MKNFCRFLFSSLLVMAAGPCLAQQSGFEMTDRPIGELFDAIERTTPYCTTSPDVPVIGFVDVSLRTQMERFLDSSYYLRYMWPATECVTLEIPAQRSIPEWGTFKTFMEELLVTPVGCGTKAPGCFSKNE